jgi:E3 ubiquitin-protein ligase HUWE1
MATFVHNEPTSLGILQDLHLPQVLYHQLEQEIPPSFDVSRQSAGHRLPQVISTVPNVVGAICLNQAGMDLTASHSVVLSNLISTTVSPGHDEAMSERDNAQHFGASLDELVRHHPPLRPIILEALLAVFRKAVDDGSAFVPSPEKKHEYDVAEASSAPLMDTDAVRDGTLPSNPPLEAFAKIFKVNNVGQNRC